MIQRLPEPILPTHLMPPTSHPSAVAKPPLLTRVRALEPRDFGVLADLLADSFHARQGWQRWLYPLWRAGIHEELRGRWGQVQSARSPAVCLVALAAASPTVASSEAIAPEDLSPQSGTILGTVELAVKTPGLWPPRRPLSCLYAVNLAVRRDVRRRGVGQALLAACEQTACQWGFQALYLHVAADNLPARRLYAQAGYRPEFQPSPHWASSLMGNWAGASPRLLLSKRLGGSPQAESGRRSPQGVLQP